MSIDWTQAEQNSFNRLLIQEVRKSLGMTRKALAQAVEVAPQTISNIEGVSKSPKGELRGCKTAVLLRVADVLDIPKEALAVSPSQYISSAGIRIIAPNTVNFRPSKYPGDALHHASFEEPWQRSPLMLVICPLHFEIDDDTSETFTVERVFAAMKIERKEYLFELRTWADLVDGGKQLRIAEESLMTLPASNSRNEERRSAVGYVNRAWSAQAESPMTNSVTFQPFQLNEKHSKFSMEACFQSPDVGLAWGDFCYAIDREEVPKFLKLTIGAVISGSETGTASVLCRTTIESRCLKRIKRWVEDRSGDDYFVRHLQPRVVEGKENYCGRQGHCCFTPNDECRPTRFK